MTQFTCALCEPLPQKKIGAAGDTVDVYALRGGAGVDSVFQLGVAHAHIVAELPTPALLVGVSAGAVHATAIAEILQAPAQLNAEERAERGACRAAQLNRFREILSAYQHFATDLPGTLPDAFEADAGRPLRPNPQAIHFRTERDSRQQALRARSGLIALFNDLFQQRITVRTMTRLVRAWLGRRAAAELRGWRGRALKVRESWNLLKAVAAAPVQCWQLLMSVIHAYVGGTARVLRTPMKKWHPSAFRTWLDLRLHQLEGRHGEGYTAGEIIFSSKRPRIAPHLLLFGLAGLTVLVLGGWATFALASLDPGFFFLYVVPAFAVLIACAIYDVIDELPTLVEAWRTADWKERILAYYDLRQDLGNDYLVEDLLIRLFDPTYHGEIDMADVADRAMSARDEAHRPTRDHEPRRFGSFPRSAYAKMTVVPFVAELASGKMNSIEEDQPIVDGLRAAVATVPLLRPVPNKSETEFYVDGSNVASDATSPAVDVLRRHLHPEAKKVRLFSVVPVTLRDRREERDSAMGTVEVALAGLELSAFRDSQVDQELVELYNALLPETSHAPERLPSKQQRALACFGDGQHFVRSELISIEPAVALHTTGKFLEAKSKTERQSVIAKAVAEGCRATLAAHLGKTAHGCRAMVDRQDAPGAIEVCSHCTAFAPEVKIEAVLATLQPQAAASPAAAPAEPPRTPTVNLLFSGGVFRGVFQIGVLNALHELGVKPNVIAGSSVGSIVAAMIASVFTAERKSQEIARLAATFMTLDRLIITDRFADFVRRFTLRAAAARFSLKDTDAFFRNYDHKLAEFGAVARRVIGGLEHLFYVSPFELSALIQAFRAQDYSKAKRLITSYAQEICDRGLVGSEILGAEPLALLIKQHVLGEDDRRRHTHAIPLDSLGGDAITFLLTATNLTTRELRIFSSAARGENRAALVDALLASSAFPGVFRPRWSREILFHDNTQSQFIDGGVLDNLPVSAVVDHMYHAALESKIAFRPENNQPHLVLTASLEPESPPMRGRAAARLGRAWTAARDRATRLKYNQKIDRFAKAQRDLRFIWDLYASAPQPRPVGLDTLDIEVVVVKPKWLCDTFAFHPMLGFRRERQAASIAHGCAATLSTFACMMAGKSESDPRWVDGWTDPAKTKELLVDDAMTLTPIERGGGKCHFRRNTPCPFAYQSLQDIDEKVMHDGVKREVDMIYQACGKPETHTPDY